MTVNLDSEPWRRAAQQTAAPWRSRRHVQRSKLKQTHDIRCLERFRLQPLPWSGSHHFIRQKPRLRAPAPATLILDAKRKLILDRRGQFCSDRGGKNLRGPRHAGSGMFGGRRKNNKKKTTRKNNKQKQQAKTTSKKREEEQARNQHISAYHDWLTREGMP
jgi:hypothetical protein